jgi:TonB family protein
MRTPSASANAVLSGAVFVVVAVALLRAQPVPASLEALTQAAPTAGVVARLSEFSGRPDVQSRLASYLRHPDPAVRAAAARVIFMTGNHALAAPLAEALATDATVDPLLEMSRALAHLGDGSHDELLFAAWKRLGANGAWKGAVAYALARGPSALSAVPALAGADPGAWSLAAMIRAARPDRTTLMNFADAARAAGDADMYGAALLAARALTVPVDDAALAAALASDVPEIRRSAVVHVLSAWKTDAVPTPALRAALHDVGPLGPEDDPIADVARELAQRAGGRAASTSADWTTLVNEPPLTLTGLLRLPGAHRLLTETERRRIARRLPNTDLDRAEPDSQSDVPPPGAVRLANGYPAGFMTSIFEATGCDARRIGEDAIGAASASFARDGRLGRATPLDTGVPDAACRDAVRIALRTLVTDDGDIAGAQRIVVVPFDLDLQQCLDGQAHAAPWSSPTGLTEMELPRKTRHRDPRYPANALQEGVKGAVRLATVIGTSGCPQQIEVVRSADPRLDVAALRSVLGWRFSPTLVAGRPVPFPVQVEVTFSIRR